MAGSMTGYGKGIFEDGGKKFSVEMKAVNNKYSEFNLRLPRLFNPLEERLRKLFASEISRGRVDVFINFENRSEDSHKIKYNKTLAEAYVNALKALSQDLNLAPNHDTLFNLISRFPDVIEIDREFGEEQLEELWQGLEAAAKAALERFIAMRLREGNLLKKDIKERLDKISEMIVTVEAKVPEVTENHRTKLKKRMEEALAGVALDETRFLNEVAHFCDKSDISEEITRLKSHIIQFRAILGTQDETTGAHPLSASPPDPIGRKLDFVTQEMAREANTMGSKANFADITKIVIELKSEIEKIREQVQNIE
jgi:uncharacterized protein (TIGR00255 family)